MTYFDLADSTDTDAYLAQFAPDAVVEDEDREHRGLAAIAAWRREGPPVRHDVRRTVRPAPGVEDATVQISGDFPGSPVTLRFHLEHDADGLISVLRIRP